MARKTSFLLTEEQFAKNPAVNRKVVEQALEMRSELERLGVWQDSGSRVTNPFATKPTVKPIAANGSRRIIQNR
ncbi:hypothetical protein [Candidatus Foliamicus sp.]